MIFMNIQDISPFIKCILQKIIKVKCLNGEKMRIYGVMDEKTNEVKDFVLYAPSDCSLICLFGTLSMDAMAKIASND